MEGSYNKRVRGLSEILNELRLQREDHLVKLRDLIGIYSMEANEITLTKYFNSLIEGFVVMEDYTIEKYIAVFGDNIEWRDEYITTVFLDSDYSDTKKLFK